MSMAGQSPPVRVVIKLPYNRPEDAPPDPPKIDWTPEKADILWKVIELQRTRATDSGGADWKGLAAHLEVPLPYLLYRVNARFQEEIRGLSAIQGALSPTSVQQQAKSVDFPALPNGAGTPVGVDKPPSLATRMIQNQAEPRLSSSRSSLNGSPMTVRARLTSLTKELAANATPRQKKANVSSSVLTLQAIKRTSAYGTPLRRRPTSPSSSNDGEVEEDIDSSDEEAIREEDAERAAEEQEALANKLAELQRMMTSEKLGLVSTRSAPESNAYHKGKAPARDRGRPAPISPRSAGSASLSSRNAHSSHHSYSYSNSSQSLSHSRSASHSLSSTSSPQGSIPEIPSPSSDRSGVLPTGVQPLTAAPSGRNFSRNQKGGSVGGLASRSMPSSPPRLKSLTQHVQTPAQRRFGPLVDRMSDLGSNHGSEASSFSDLSDASISASALEDAFMSNLGGSNASHVSQFNNKSRISNRTQSSGRRTDSRSAFGDNFNFTSRSPN